MNNVIAVENLGKKYRLGASRSNERYTTLRDTISEKIRSVFGNRCPAKPNGSSSDRQSAVFDRQAEEFWALKDVSFEVKQGEVLGIIGRNGAGKSTLLKILSRITDPTEGKIRIKGRVASLLEVGTGFHPELTGRENIFLNGAILGMTRAEIRTKFDEIVAFAEVERFLDTPVKRYSSGMYVRLAFAVAAHLDPEILVVDEVLAVGDAEFQKKCLGKMKQVAASNGRTVLFVSHNMNAVRSLCQRGILLEQGRRIFEGSASAAVTTYASRSEKSKGPAGETVVRGRFFKCLRSRTVEGQYSHSFPPLARVVFELSIDPAAVIRVPRIGVAFANERGERVFAVGSFLGPTELPSISSSSTITAEFTLPALFPGSYTIDLGAYDEGGMIEELFGAAELQLSDDNVLNTLHAPTAALGSVMVASSWSVRQNGEPRPDSSPT